VQKFADGSQALLDGHIGVLAGACTTHFKQSVALDGRTVPTVELDFGNAIGRGLAYL
jgi:hypothetical protein